MKILKHRIICKQYVLMLFTVVFLNFLLPVIAIGQTEKKYEWRSLFNGKNFTGWNIKITGSPVNVNYKNTFRIKDSAIIVCYDDYTAFNDAYGHIYYKKPYSNYILRLQYRFTGSQLNGGASWNERNSGVMIHSQSAASMGINQSFPVSLEVQFLGGLGKGERSTANLCTPGTTMRQADTTFLEHILQSSSKTYNGDQWINITVVVLGDSLVEHYVNGEKVLAYTKPKIGGGFVNAGYTWKEAHVPNTEAWIKKDGQPLKSGYIALQAESHPVAFRRIELLNLDTIKNWRKLDLKQFLE